MPKNPAAPRSRSRLVDALRHDVLFGVRILLKSPGLTIILLLTLAIGIGATTAAFGVIDAVLLRPLPIRDQDRVVVLSATNAARGNTPIGLPSSGVAGLAESSGAFARVAPIALQGTVPFAARFGDRLFPVTAMFVGGDFFSVLGALPAAGRLLSSADDAPGAGPSVVLSYRAWQRDFGGDSSVIGKSIAMINGPETIVGVAPAGFDYPAGTDVWVAMAPVERMFPSAPGPNAGFPTQVVARLRPGVTLVQARAAFANYLERYPARSLGDSTARIAHAELFAARVVGDVRPALVILSLAVALVLLIALTNAAGLLVTRGLARRSELALRSALGAGRGRIIRQLLTEHALLGAGAGALGVWMAVALLRIAPRVAPSGLLPSAGVRLDLPVLAFAVGLTLAAVLAFGFAPALLATRSDPEVALRAGGSRISGRRHEERGRRLIVAAQVALAVVVLTGAGLLARSLDRLQRVDLGFAPQSLLVVGLEDMTPFDAHTQSWALGAARYDAVLDAMSSQLPKVHGIVGVTTLLVRPLSGTAYELPFAASGSPSRDTANTPRVAWQAGLPSHFHTMGTPLLRGRDFTADDGAGAPAVAVVNEAFARREWPGRDPIGLRVRLNPSDSTQPWRTVIGVAANARFRGVTTPPEPTVYVPVRQTAVAPMFLAVRTTGDDPSIALAPLKRILRQSNPSFGIRDVTTGGALVGEQLSRPRFLADTLVALSGAALFLSAVGLYGLLAAAVRERRREIAIRIALGATPAEVRTLIMRQAAYILALGIVAGTALSFAGTRLLGSVLYEVSTTDPLTFVGVALALFGTAAIAAYAPAARAARVDPATVLGAE